jgi:hypothetical protein
MIECWGDAWGTPSAFILHPWISNQSELNSELPSYQRLQHVDQSIAMKIESGSCTDDLSDGLKRRIHNSTSYSVLILQIENSRLLNLRLAAIVILQSLLIFLTKKVAIISHTPISLMTKIRRWVVTITTS